jgi:hypothetical protein
MFAGTVSVTLYSKRHIINERCIRKYSEIQRDKNRISFLIYKQRYSDAVKRESNQI